MSQETHILRIQGEDRNENEYLARINGFDQREPDAKNEKLNELGGLLQVIRVILMGHVFEVKQQANDLGLHLFWRGASECITLDIHFYEGEILQDALLFTTSYEGKRALVHIEHELKRITSYRITRLVA
jgi:hypothetical protein